MYKRLAEVRSKTDVEALREELVDRYGTPPLPVDRLLMVALFRVRARAAGLNEVTIQAHFVELVGGLTIHAELRDCFSNKPHIQVKAHISDMTRLLATEQGAVGLTSHTLKITKLSSRVTAQPKIT